MSDEFMNSWGSDSPCLPAIIDLELTKFLPGFKIEIKRNILHGSDSAQHQYAVLAEKMQSSERINKINDALQNRIKDLVADDKFIKAFNRDWQKTSEV